MFKIVSLSDTHDHLAFTVPAGDLLIHAGDATEHGQQAGLEEVNRWFISQPHAHKIFVPGNHDLLFQKNLLLARSILNSAICLIDEEVTLSGLRIYGSPWTPKHGNWAFMLSEKELYGKFAMIPEAVDVLITHSPPFEILDHGWGANNGSISLRRRLQEMKFPPKLHFFGHIHPAHGTTKIGATQHFNIALCDEKKQLKRAATVVHYDQVVP